MKNIENFKSPKYDDPRYEMVLPDIYKVTRKVNDDRLSTKFTQSADEEAEVVRDIEGWEYSEKYSGYLLSYNDKLYYRDNNHRDDVILEYDTSEETYYLTSLSFVQEPELGEGEDASNISQYPLEDIMDEWFCWVSDFYDDLNIKGSEKCYQEFASYDLETLVGLRTIIGKRVYSNDDGFYITEDE